MESWFNRRIKTYTLKGFEAGHIVYAEITQLPVRALLLSHVGVDVAWVRGADENHLFPNLLSEVTLVAWSQPWWEYLYLGNWKMLYIYINAMCLCASSLSRVRLFATPWTVAHQTPLSMGFSKQEYWNGLPCPPPGDLPNPGIEPRSPALQADSLLSEPPGKPINAIDLYKRYRCVSAAAASKSLQSCPTLCDPIDGSPPGSPSLGFSRQEHWSGFSFPSPMHESEKWNWSHSVMSDS